MLESLLSSSPILYSLLPHRVTSTQGTRARLYNNIYNLRLNCLHREFTYKHGLHNKILTRLSTIQHLQIHRNTIHQI